jgi:ATP-dependent Zn protease
MFLRMANLMVRGKGLSATAYHEAGHAVVSYEYGLRLTGVSIVPSEDGLGRTSHQALTNFNPDVDKSNRSRLRGERLIQRQMAGMAAEWISTGRRRRNWRGAQWDWDLAADLALYFTGSSEETDAYLKWLWIRTVNSLSRQLVWRKVEAVAIALLDRRELTRSEVKEILVAEERRFLRPPEYFAEMVEARVVRREG